MDLVVFENNKPWVIDEFREGHFDYVELASDVAETKFFQFLFGQQVVDRLVQHWAVENQATAGKGLPSDFVSPFDSLASETDAATA